jgi:hypothetical protein
LDEYRRCLEMLAAVASGMDRRDAPADERRIVSGFINMQFAGSPEALYISNTRIAKITENAGGNPLKTGSGKGKGHESTNGVPNGVTGSFVNRYLSAREKTKTPNKPCALVVIGPPGTGKHKAATRLQGGYSGSVGLDSSAGLERPCVVCTEDFMYHDRLAKKLLARHLNIHMDNVSREARRMERGCLKALVDAKVSVVWLTSGEQKEAVTDTLRTMQSGGYKVEIVFLAAPGKISAARALFEYEWLKDKTGMAFMPMARCHNDSFRFLSHTCRAVTEDRLVNCVRVLDGEGGEMNISDIPLLGFGEKPHGVMLREQSREISPDENRRCLEMLTAVADGMDRRDAPLDERYMVAAFIRSQFAGSPEAIHISKTRIGKNQPKAGWQAITPSHAEAVGC